MLNILCSIFIMCNVCTAVICSCPNHNGDPVSWWLLYQEKHQPFLHFYIDSTNKDQIKQHFPERVDSVLSRTVSTLIDNEDTEYVAYSSDLINTRQIAKSLNIPMHSKFMHGIIVSNNSWKSGFWILHNNLFFPPIKDGSLDLPGTNLWKHSTMGDSDADIFYLCLSAENKDEMNIMLRKMLTGNPFIFLKRLHGSPLDEVNLQAVTPLDSSFWLQWSASVFMNCMYANVNETSKHCLFNYSVTTETEIIVLTRPRGMIRRGKAFCYNSQSKSSNEFIELQDTSTNNPDWTNSIFTLTDQSDSSLSGVTCFGQDIAANTETVAIMICFRLPQLYESLLKLSKISNWPCPTRRNKPESSTKVYARRKPSTISENVGMTASSLGNHIRIGERLNGIDDAEEISMTKICTTITCDSNHKNLWKTTFGKDNKLGNRFEDIVSDINQKTDLSEPSKTNKQKTQPKTVIHLSTAADVHKYLFNNENAVLGLFCREGCRFCQKAKQEFILLRSVSELQLKTLDLVLVDVNEPNVAAYFNTPWTPFLRYKERGKDGTWKEYKGLTYSIFSMLEFLQTTSISAVRIGYVKRTPENVVPLIPRKTNSLVLETNNRFKRETKKSKQTEATEKFSENFKWRHLWKVSKEDFKSLKSDRFSRWKFRVACSRIVKLAKGNYFKGGYLSNRNLMTFIVFHEETFPDTLFKYINPKTTPNPYDVSVESWKMKSDNLFVHVGLKYKTHGRGLHDLDITSVKIEERGTFTITVDKAKIVHFAKVEYAQNERPRGTCEITPRFEMSIKNSRLTNTDGSVKSINDIKLIDDICKQ